MNNVFMLLKGELKRLVKYKILTVGLFVSAIWALIIALSDREELTVLLPLLIGVDATMMSIILLAAGYFLEKQEGSVKSLFVAPVSGGEILFAKVMAALLSGLLSGAIVALTARFTHDIRINLLLLAVYLIIIVVSHTAVGYVLALYAKDFGTLLSYTLIFAFLSYIPSLLFMTGIIPLAFEKVMLVLPTHDAMMLLRSLTDKVDTIIVLLSVIYQVVFGLTLYFAVVYKKFKKTVAES
ncbi:MAG: ABC transporter permease [Bacilli bacterium]|nr:ABC transporter permease [Bacilli bacterium]MDD4077539.1 ABC transporter permease [Bacilli bacterium]